MSETREETSEVVEPQIVYVGHRRAYIQRFGCGCAVLLWGLVLLIPGLLFVLAIQGEIVLWHGSRVPEPEIHPLIQVKLLMEARTRGLSVTTSTPNIQPESLTCMQTHVRYLLWQGSGENVSYCDCYTRPDESASWELVNTHSGECGS